MEPGVRGQGGLVGLWWRSSRVREGATYLLSVLMSLLATVVSLQLWRADWRVPFTYYGDAVAVSAHFKTVIETGWYESQSLLAAPTGQVYHDFPTADNLNFAAAHVLSWFTSDFAVAVNVYYVVGFLLAALTAVWFLRECRVSRWLTVPLAVLYAIAPYHFIRGEGHLWLASYFTLPLALVVVLRVVRGDRLWGGRPSRWRLLGLLTGRGASTLLCLVLVTTGSTYYGVFVVVMIAAAAIVSWWRSRSWRRFGGAVVAGTVVVATALANMAPDLLYTQEHGSSLTGLVRSPEWTEIYALKLAQLLLPVPGHRIGILATIREKYDSVYPLVSEYPSLGAVAATGLVIALLVALVSLGGRRSQRLPELTAEQTQRTRTIALLSALTLFAFLVATVGGLATFVSFVTDSLRGWNRMSIIIAMFALAVVGLVLDAWLSRFGRRWSWRPVTRRSLAGGLAVLVLLVGFFDQTTAGDVPDYEANAAAFEADATWVAQVEDVMPDDAMIFQAPYVAFPETSPVNGVFDTDQLKMYLHSSTLRWSSGGIKGRSTTDWPGEVEELPAEQMVSSLAAVGFSGVMIDRQRYGEDAAAQMEQGLTAVVGAPETESADGRYALYSLVEAQAQVAAENSAEDVARVAEATVAPVLAYSGVAKVTAAADSASGLEEWELGSGTGALALENGRDHAVTVRITATVSTTQTTTSVPIQIGDQRYDVPVADGGGQLDVEVAVGAGQQDFEVLPGADGAVTLIGVSVTEEDLPVLSLG